MSAKEPQSIAAEKDGEFALGNANRELIVRMYTKTVAALARVRVGDWP